MIRILKMEKQIIIFCHKRAETYNTAKELIEILKTKGKKTLDLFTSDSQKLA